MTLLQLYRDSYSSRYEYTDVWDAEKIQGCYCDYPAYGYDCSLTQCPTGDDPLTTGQVNEIQVLECTGTAGYFTLFYGLAKKLILNIIHRHFLNEYYLGLKRILSRGISSSRIPVTATADMVKNALLSIPILTGVKVTYSQPHGKACQLQSNLITIEFTEQFGPQNPLVPFLDPVFIETGGEVRVNADGSTFWRDATGNRVGSVKGSKENNACSGRGICDLDNGVCACFETNGDVYGSSNGYGVAGTRGDCGYVHA